MTYRARTVVANFHQLFVHQLDASQTRRLEQLDLRLDEQIKRDLWNKQARPRPRRVPNSRSDVLRRQVVRRIHGFKRHAEYIVEDVVYPRTAAELFSGEFHRGSIDGSDKVSREFRHELEHERALLMQE